MGAVLVTGMSGTGKSSALAELERRGFEVVDTDRGGWTFWWDAEDGHLWDEERIAELLDRKRTRTLYVSGTVSNQGRFYPRFDAVVLLSAPAEVLLARIANRQTNDYGKRCEERELILRHLWPRSNRCCARPARTSSTRRNRSSSSSPSWSRSERTPQAKAGADEFAPPPPSTQLSRTR